MKLLNLQISADELLNALLRTPEEKAAFLREHFPARRATFSVEEACEYIGIGRTKLFESSIPYKIVEGSRRYTREQLDAYLTKLPDRTGGTRARVIKPKQAA